MQISAIAGDDQLPGIEMNTSRRRLSAILHSDLTGFVRLMEGGEDRTVDLLKSAQADVWRPAIATAGGSLINIVGDSVLAEFDSAVAAVATAIDIQERMTRFNSMLDEEQRLMFRIGVHLGEVIVDEENNTIFGDGVNVAARIQAMAEPGGIAVSRAVRDVAELRIEYARRRRRAPGEEREPRPADLSRAVTEPARRRRRPHP